MLEIDHIKRTFVYDSVQLQHVAIISFNLVFAVSITGLSNEISNFAIVNILLHKLKTLFEEIVLETT